MFFSLISFFMIAKHLLNNSLCPFSANDFCPLYYFSFFNFLVFQTLRYLWMLSSLFIYDLFYYLMVLFTWFLEYNRLGIILSVEHLYSFVLEYMNVHILQFEPIEYVLYVQVFSYKSFFETLITPLLFELSW